MAYPPVTVAPVTVTAHRRQRVTLQFPFAQSGGYPTRGGGASDEMLTDPGETPGETPPFVCDDPMQRLELNTDAAAAEAREQMIQKAAQLGDQYPFSREFAAVLYQRSDGTVGVGRVSHGALFSGNAPIDLTGINMRDVVGLIHNHPGGTNNPSAADWHNFSTYWQPQIAAAGGDPGAFRYYIIGNDNDAGGPPRHRIFIYDKSNQNQMRGPEVDPQSQACPIY